MTLAGGGCFTQWHSLWPFQATPSGEAAPGKVRRLKAEVFPADLDKDFHGSSQKATKGTERNKQKHTINQVCSFTTQGGRHKGTSDGTPLFCESV
jgi:hypothetical protein